MKFSIPYIKSKDFQLGSVINSNVTYKLPNLVDPTDYSGFILYSVTNTGASPIFVNKCGYTLSGPYPYVFSPNCSLDVLVATLDPGVTKIFIGTNYVNPNNYTTYNNFSDWSLYSFNTMRLKI